MNCKENNKKCNKYPRVILNDDGTYEILIENCVETDPHVKNKSFTIKVANKKKRL